MQPQHIGWTAQTVKLQSDHQVLWSVDVSDSVSDTESLSDSEMLSSSKISSIGGNIRLEIGQPSSTFCLDLFFYIFINYFPHS